MLLSASSQVRRQQTLEQHGRNRMGPSVCELSVSDVRLGVRRHGGCTDLATLRGDWSTGFRYVRGVLEPTPRSAQGQLKFLGSQVICGCSTAQGWVSLTPRCSRVSAPKCYQLQHRTFHFPVDTGHISVHTH